MKPWYVFSLISIPKFTFDGVGRGQLALTRSCLTAWNLGRRFTQNVGQLIAFLSLAALGGSAALSVRIVFHVCDLSYLCLLEFRVCGAVISDTWQLEERGDGHGPYALVLGPSIGPVVGAWIAENLLGDGFFGQLFAGLVEVLGLYGRPRL